nr:uncharacterized protein LOC109172123 [Ipomoea batatas]
MCKFRFDSTHYSHQSLLVDFQSHDPLTFASLPTLPIVLALAARYNQKPFFLGWNPPQIPLPNPTRALRSNCPRQSSSSLPPSPLAGTTSGAVGAAMYIDCGYMAGIGNWISDAGKRGENDDEGFRRILFDLKCGQMKACDSDAGTEILDIILARETSGAGKLNIREGASSPPFFFGSPPSRASNPLIQDAHFSKENFVPPLATLTSPSPPLPSSSPSSARKNGGGCGMKFGHKPAPVRIEGFNCNGNCRVSAVA